ncbi:hypothetical protein QBC34DRAFT_425289 [Podospora aff. communis PSN243]|uniref:Uncharacterized protein n=1 Tax=Podospora aff. communis PSN243 TaxID=3040156 RepID=A0AAV9GPG0_9PEZI|nr:hypothetical protein QBC34DRAFT_425289 [Podospora aff. communis PSN243]
MCQSRVGNETIRSTYLGAFSKFENPPSDDQYSSVRLVGGAVAGSVSEGDGLEEDADSDSSFRSPDEGLVFVNGNGGWWRRAPLTLPERRIWGLCPASSRLKGGTRKGKRCRPGDRNKSAQDFASFGKRSVVQTLRQGQWDTWGWRDLDDGLMGVRLRWKLLAEGGPHGVTQLCLWAEAAGLPTQICVERTALDKQGKEPIELQEQRSPSVTYQTDQTMPMYFCLITHPSSTAARDRGHPRSSHPFPSLPGIRAIRRDQGRHLAGVARKVDFHA